MRNYPYKKDSRGNLFPIILFQVEYKKSIAKTSALIDSGATISIFREDVAKQLGLNIIQGTTTFLGGVGGRIKGYIHNLKLKIADKNLIVPVVFSYEYTVFDKKIVNPDEAKIYQYSDRHILTLMTCWPAGTSLKRLIIQAQIRPLDK